MNLESAAATCPEPAMSLVLITVAFWIAIILSYLVCDVPLWIGLAGGGLLHLPFTLGIFHPAPSWICPTITRGRRTKGKLIALTFDDGPSPTVTPKVLRILKERSVAATFFVIGQRVRRYPEIARAVVAAGHEIANHSFLHPRHVYLWGGRALRRDTMLAQRVLKRVVGRTPVLYRPPVAFRSLEMRSVMRAAGLRVVNFSARAFDTQDVSPEAIVSRITRAAAPGAIILLHDGSDRTPQPNRQALLAALPAVIDRLAANGYRFVTVSDLLA